ncbi:MAG: fumarate hydratase [Candidatus Altiarchaeales archaeon]|nr:MAG: fumarate hydratase [Candidatus Altiarchaeales archaeon]HDI73273.1 fumarate hydratase [Candidatus Altiarchaeales archaeon]
MYLITPLQMGEIKRLKIGEIVYLSGKISTARDKAHERALKENKFPVDLTDGVIFHSGPIVRKRDDELEIVSIGPTTSSRMNSLEPEFIDRFGIRAIIGKGGMDKEVVGAMKNKAIYLAMTGGCAATAASQIKKVMRVEWLDLGIPEAVFVLEVEKFGPLVVTIDSNGNSLYENVEMDVEYNLKKILDNIDHA